MNEGAKLRDEGMARVEEATEKIAPSWKDTALAIVRLVARKQAEFCADDLHRVADLVELEEPSDKRAWGPVMMVSIRRGVCEKSGKYCNSERAKVHAMPLPIYTSLLYEEEE